VRGNDPQSDYLDASAQGWPEHFDPLWKLAYMWEHPLHFPLAMWTAITVWGDRLWQELIGILGWQDVMLPVWTYVALTVLLLFVSLQTFDVRGAPRTRVAIVTAIGLVCYIITVYLIFFLTYTPLDVDHVRGVKVATSSSLCRWPRSSSPRRSMSPCVAV
jgi:hypothetical protein